MRYLVVRDTPYENGTPGTYPVVEVTFEKPFEALRYVTGHPGTRVIKAAEDPDYANPSPYDIYLGGADADTENL